MFVFTIWGILVCGVIAIVIIFFIFLFIYAAIQNWLWKHKE